MSVRLQAHKTALTELVELFTISGMLAIIADIIWAAYEISVVGFHWPLLVVLGTLSIAAVIVFAALYKYHLNQVRGCLRRTLEERIKKNKARLKHLKETKK